MVTCCCEAGGGYKLVICLLVLLLFRSLIGMLRLCLVYIATCLVDSTLTTLAEADLIIDCTRRVEIFGRSKSCCFTQSKRLIDQLRVDLARA